MGVNPKGLCFSRLLNAVQNASSAWPVAAVVRVPRVDAPLICKFYKWEGGRFKRRNCHASVLPPPFSLFIFISSSFPSHPPGTLNNSTQPALHMLSRIHASLGTHLSRLSLRVKIDEMARNFFSITHFR